MDNEALLDRLLAVTHLLHTDITRFMSERTLTVPRARAVWALSEYGPSMQRDLATVLRTTPRNMTAIVDALIDAGFASREPHPTDRRAVLVTLTASGEALADRLRSGQARLADHLFSHLTVDERSSLAARFDELAERVQQALAAAAGSSEPFTAPESADAGDGSASGAAGSTQPSASVTADAPAHAEA